jgi:hypothetical protein
VSEDAKPDLPPPRYEQHGGWKHLICDEQEWLARPASWGIDRLPEEVRGRKRNLFNARYYGWLAEFIQCPECRPHVRALFSEEGLRVPSTLAMSGDDRRGMREQFQARYVTFHPDGNCDAEPIIRCVCNYECGILTQTELFNRAVDELFSLEDRLDRKDQMPYRRQLREVRERELTRELVGPNPFRPIAFSPEWGTSTVMSLARQMYESREFSAMPILADALQDSGCDNTDILSHCRDTSLTHVRGCWVVDLVLGKS